MEIEINLANQKMDMQDIQINCSNIHSSLDERLHEQKSWNKENPDKISKSCKNKFQYFLLKFERVNEI